MWYQGIGSGSLRFLGWGFRTGIQGVLRPSQSLGFIVIFLYLFLNDCYPAAGVRPLGDGSCHEGVVNGL